jgi:hypothetical protein
MIDMTEIIEMRAVLWDRHEANLHPHCLLGEAHARASRAPSKSGFNAKNDKTSKLEICGDAKSLMLSCNSTSFEKNACTSLAPCPDRQ